MKIILNGIEMAAYGTDVVLGLPVRGLVFAPIRMAEGNYSGRDGGWVSSVFTSKREIVLKGTIDGRSCADAAAKLCKVLGSFRIRQLLPMYIEVDEGTTYFTEVYIAPDPQLDIDSERFHEFQIALIAPDSNFYLVDPNDPNGGWITVDVEEPGGGGYPTPYVLPVVWNPSSQPTIVNNPTDQTILPQILLEGKFTNPRITNTTTGQFIELGLTTTIGDHIEIDMKNRTVTLNGGSILPTKSGTWWGLLEGDNYIELQTDAEGDNKEGTIRYRPGYSGIYAATC